MMRNPMLILQTDLQATQAFKNEIKNRILKNADILYEDMGAIHELEFFFERVVKEKMKH